MSRVATYLGFDGTAEAAFSFYASVFGTELSGPIARMGDMPDNPNGPALTDSEKNFVMHAELPILGGHCLMATDMVESMGQKVRIGNNVTINLDMDSHEEVDRLYAALSEGGSESVVPSVVPWGYWGVTLDRFGIRWMFNSSAVA